jgi:hypothetical protein
VGVGVPVQVPRNAVTACPTRGVPEIEGATVLTGPLADGADVTTAVAVELLVAEPAAFVAVTSTCSLDPTSAATTR